MISSRRTFLWRSILLLLAVTVRVHSQLDSNGFLSIDCGLSGTSSYVDNSNQLNYVSDEQFIDTGVNSNISSEISSGLDKTNRREYLTVRYFPNGTRNCYTLRSLTIGSNYLIRGLFYYGNYDNSNKPPTFDIYVGINFWDTVYAKSDSGSFHEIIVTANADFLDVCLVNTKQGIPFISSLHLRQLKIGLYPYVNSTTTLILVRRDNLGAPDWIVRYPEDKYDRWWLNSTFKSKWSAISTNVSTSYLEQQFETPSLVLQTAATSSSTSQPFVIDWKSDDVSTKYYFILHFYEIQNTTKTGSRDFYINYQGSSMFGAPYPGPLGLGWVFSVATGSTGYSISLNATSNSTLPPSMNAFELYTVASVGVPTYVEDVAAINSVKEYYKIKKGWSGDPCLPRQFLWTDINCTTNPSNITRITSLNLSSSFLTDPLIDSFGNLTDLEYLYLSNNDLSGSLPSSLDKLTALKLLDITGNKNISSTLPPWLLKRQQDGSLIFRYGASTSPSPSPASSKKNFIIPIAVVVPLLVIAVAVAIVIGLNRRKYKRSTLPKGDENFESNIQQSCNPNGEPQSKGGEQILPNFENRKFSYNDLKKITNVFKDSIGTGGYGSVYMGILENGVQVAVKMRSESSSQGVKEFLAEAENLARVHHKNLVSLMGYCMDKNCMALVYEYMHEGNLHDKLRDTARPLDWKQRLRIAYESAQGLEYLHKACNPPLIHRDVKTSNILLSENLEAKIADFGLSRASNKDATSHFSTRVVGTPGYLDPEYYLWNQLSAKSDVFSFGIVLLEIVTGRPPLSAELEGGNLVQWVRQHLSGGDIESIVDPKMQNQYDINSVWKVTDLACKCTENSSSKRPTMSAVVIELYESLNLEASMEETHNGNINSAPDINQNNIFDMAYIDDRPVTGPSVR